MAEEYFQILRNIYKYFKNKYIICHLKALYSLNHIV